MKWYSMVTDKNDVFHKCLADFYGDIFAYEDFYGVVRGMYTSDSNETYFRCDKVKTDENGIPVRLPSDGNYIPYIPVESNIYVPIDGANFI